MQANRTELKVRHKRINGVWFHSHEISRINAFIQDSIDYSVTLGLAGEEMHNYWLTGTKYLFGRMKSFANSSNAYTIFKSLFNS